MEVAKKDDRPTRKLFLLLSDGEDYGAELKRALDTLRAATATASTASASASDEPVPIPVTQRRTGARPTCATTRAGAVTTQFAEARSARSPPPPAAATSGRRPASELAAGDRGRSSSGERRLLGWRTITEYRDLYPAALAVAARRRARPSGCCSDD